MCVCVCVSVLPQKCCLNSIISKSKQVAAIKLGNPVQKVDLYKMSRFLQANVAQIVSKFENKKLIVQVLHERLSNQANGMVLLETQNEEEITLEFSQNCSCVEI